MISRKPNSRIKRSQTRLNAPGRKKRRKKGEITKLKAKLWELCKKITRARCVQPDDTWICYTSGVRIIYPKDAHTGHCIPSSLCSTELRYDLKNLRVQSYDQNINKNGNPLQFERNLIRDHGQEYMDDLWNRNEETKGKTYGKDWYVNKITEYTALIESYEGMKERTKHIFGKITYTCTKCKEKTGIIYSFYEKNRFYALCAKCNDEHEK